MSPKNAIVEPSGDQAGLNMAVPASGFFHVTTGDPSRLRMLNDVPTKSANLVPSGDQLNPMPPYGPMPPPVNPWA